MLITLHDSDSAKTRGGVGERVKLIETKSEYSFYGTLGFLGHPFQ